ncbi:MAG: hypothetical protein ACUVTW_06900 [Thermogutta sp.]
MSIEFLCPNGHRIRCSEDRAGKPAKCPRCGIKFLIPTLEEIAAAEKTEEPGANRSPGKDGKIEFLCPNGHRLFGPGDLQGKPGKCPECGSTFRIPSYEELSESEQTAATPLSVAADSAIEAKRNSLAVGQGLGDSAITIDSGLQLDLTGGRLTGDSQRASAPRPISAGSAENGGLSLAEIYRSIWEAKPAGAELRVELEGGRSLLVEQSFLSWTGEKLLVVRAEESPYGRGLVVVPWSAVRLVHIKGMTEPPTPHST